MNKNPNTFSLSEMPKGDGWPDWKRRRLAIDIEHTFEDTRPIAD